MHDLQQAVVVLLARNLNTITRTRVNLLCVVIIIDIGLQPMTKMTIKMMSMKKTFKKDIVAQLGNMLVIIKRTV